MKDSVKIDSVPDAVAVLGEGSWGTAMATVLAANGLKVKLWCHDAQIAQEIKKSRINEQYLPGIVLSDLIEPITDMQQVLEGVKFIFEAIPTQYLRVVIAEAARYCTPEQVWVVLSKGIEQDTLLFPTQILDDVCGHEVKKAVVVGPSFADDVARKQVTAVIVAATDCAAGLEIQKLLANSYFRPYISLDVIGAQVAAALKNVIALGIGLADGAGYTDNTKVYLLTRGLQETAALAHALGGRVQTMLGLAGVGDLVLTAMGSLSRNVRLGRQLAQGQQLEEIAQQTGAMPEGINTLKSVHQLIEQKKLSLPVCHGIYRIVFEHKNLEDILQELMQRPLERECITQ